MINSGAKHQAAATVTHAMKRFTPFYDCLTLPIEWLHAKPDEPKQPETDNIRTEDISTSDRQQPAAKRKQGR